MKSTVIQDEEEIVSFDYTFFYSSSYRNKGAAALWIKKY
jgi:hypothetical protein